MRAEHDDFRIGNSRLRLDHGVDVAHRLAADHVFLPVARVAVRRQRRLEVARGFLQLVVVRDVVLARRDRLDMTLEGRGERTLLGGQRRQRALIGLPGTLVM